MLADCIVTNALEVITCAGPAPRRGARPGRCAVHRERRRRLAARAVIVFVGPAEACARDVEPAAAAPSSMHADAQSCPASWMRTPTSSMPATAANELRQRLAGATYASIAAQGGGILQTVRATRDCSEELLAASARVRLDEMLRCGTTTCEVKSGYGLTTDERAEAAAGHPAAVRWRGRSISCRRSWAPTRFRPSTASRRSDTCG